MATLPTASETSATSQIITTSQISTASGIRPEDVPTGESTSTSAAAALADASPFKFGSAKTRYDENGNVRLATEAELAAGTRFSPAATQKLLGIGADSLRFEAGGRYAEEMQRFLDTQNRTDLSAGAKAEVLDDLVFEIRDKMRADIENGVFRVEDSGRIILTDETGTERALEPNEVGFELSALLIESLNNEVRDLNKVNSDIALIDEFVQNHFTENPEDTSVELHHTQSLGVFREVAIVPEGGDRPAENHSSWQAQSTDFQSRTFFDIPPQGFNTYQVGSTRKPPFTQFMNEKGVSIRGGKGGHEYLQGVRNEFEALMQKSGLTLPEWWLEPRATFERVSDYSYGPESFKVFTTINGELEPGSQWERVHDSRRISDVINLEDRTALTKAMEQVRSRISTVTSLTDQVATDFRVTNSRFNNVLSAMDSWTKASTNMANNFTRY